MSSLGQSGQPTGTCFAHLRSSIAIIFLNHPLTMCVQLDKEVVPEGFKAHQKEDNEKTEATWRSRRQGRRSKTVINKSEKKAGQCQEKPVNVNKE